MTERKFSFDDIEQVLDQTIRVVVIPSTREAHIDIDLAQLDNKSIALVINSETKVLITVRGMHPKEKQYYKEGKHD